MTPAPARTTTRDASRLLPWFVLAVSTLPILAHGCHLGDHDDEPLFTPPPPEAIELRAPTAASE